MAGKHYRTPKGIAANPWLNRRDEKFAKTNPETGKKDPGDFKVGLILQEGPAKEMVQEITEWAQEELSKKQLAQVNWPYKKQDDGTTRFNFKSKYKVGVADSKGKLVAEPEKLNIGSGSIIKVKTKFDTHDGTKDGKPCTFVMLRLNSVQLLKYVEYIGSGFEEDDSEGDEGYSADEGFTADSSEGSEAPKGDATSF